MSGTNRHNRVCNFFKPFAWAVLGLWAVASLLFLFLQVVPEILMRTPVGFPRPSLAGPSFSLQEQLQLKGPIYEQYLLFLKRLLTLELGPTLVGGQPVAHVLADMVPRTLTLWMLALLIALPLSWWFRISLKSTSNIKRFRSAILVLVLSSLFLPWWGSVLRWGLADQLRLLPSGGLLSPELWQQATTPVNILFLQLLGAIFLITLVNALIWAISARIPLALVRVALRFSVFMALLTTFIFAWHQANTLVLITDLLHHMALPLATLVPLLAGFCTLLSVYAGSLRAPVLALLGAFSLSLVIVVEILFSWGGMGMLWRAAVRSDFPILFGSFWVFAVIVVLTSALTAFIFKQAKPVVTVSLPKALLWVGLSALSFFVFLAVAQPLLIATVWSAPNEGRSYDPLIGYDRTLEQHPAPPSPAHLLGTDRWSRDIFSQLLHGAGQALWLGLTAALAETAIGSAFWAILKRRQMLLSFLASVTLGLPLVPTLLFWSGIFEFNHIGLGLLLGAFSWPLTLFIIESLEQRHWSRLIAAAASLTMGYAVWVGHLASFLRLGRFEALLDWGLMLDGVGLNNPIAFWWLTLPPAMSISLLTFGCYLSAWALHQRAE